MQKTGEASEPENPFSEATVLEILKRAKGKADGEIVPWNEDPNCVREEALRRNAKAGYCTRNGEPPDRTKIMIAPPTQRYRKNYVRIFGHD